nr:FH2 domain-containing protein [Tanacetum cinerariifolium]
TRSLRVSKPKKHDTLQSTWKTMTDVRHIPLNRHLKKSDTFENHNQHEPKLDYNAMKKLETFNDRTDRVLASQKLRKEGSPSQDELNRRVEAFIKKFYDDLRIKRYIDPISGCKVWRTNYKCRIPIDLYPCKVEEKMTMKKVGDQTIRVIQRRRIDREGNVSRFQEYHTSNEEEEELSGHPLYNKYRFVGHP